MAKILQIVIKHKKLACIEFEIEMLCKAAKVISVLSISYTHIKVRLPGWIPEMSKE